MFVGHCGPGFVAKRFEGSIPLWVLFIAALWLDVFWCTLVLLGINKVQILGGYAQMDPYYMPYTMKAPMTGMTLEELANMAVLMASDKASGMTGTTNLTMGSLDDERLSDRGTEPEQAATSAIRSLKLWLDAVGVSRALLGFVERSVISCCVLRRPPLGLL